MERDLRFTEETGATINDACVANTIVSICRRISGIDFEVPEVYYKWRSMMNVDMARMYAGHQRRIHAMGLPPKDRSHYDLALHKLDQRSVIKFIETAREGRGLPIEASLVQTVLQDVDIEYLKGNIDVIKNEIGLGRQVAASYQIEGDTPGEKNWHISHIGLNPEGNLVSHSDGNAPITEQIALDINSAASYLNDKAHTWNFVSVRKIGE